MKQAEWNRRVEWQVFDEEAEDDWLPSVPDPVPAA